MSQFLETVPDEGEIVYEDPSMSGEDIPVDDTSTDPGE